MTFKTGVPDKSNFDTYRMIRMGEAPRRIDVHFVENEIDPTGMGEPPFTGVCCSRQRLIPCYGPALLPSAFSKLESGPGVNAALNMIAFPEAPCLSHH